MGVEIERKFLVEGSAWREKCIGVMIRQGYLSTQASAVVRVRIAADEAFLTVKGLAEGISRPEFEYPIPLTDAEQLLTMCSGALIEKVRYLVNFEGLQWEVDVFSGANQGLIVAECELTSADQAISRPPWLGAEVSDDVRYANSNLVANPFTSW
ncbi:MAG: adenylate cyclase [Candidatus Krumholzibacteriia bacterium]|jgi:adenylate cyclase